MSYFYFMLALCGVIGYLFGSISSAIIIGKIFGKIDIREHGSGNAGATNTLRVLGVKAAIAALLGDILKGVIAVIIARALVPHNPVSSFFVGDYAAQLAGLGAVLGHNYPIYYGFKGGKGIATSLAVVLMINWEIGLIVMALGLSIMAITKIVSLGSVLAAVIYAILTIIFAPNQAIFAVILALLAVYRHKENIKRIINGTESKLTDKKKKEAGNNQVINNENEIATK